jgi:hypothetical protein
MNASVEPLEPGYLLRELGYDDEIEAAASLDITPQTMAGYRKLGIGPRYVEVARKIYYSKEARAEWLSAGGTRSADETLKGKPSSFPSGKKETPPARDLVGATTAAPAKPSIPRRPRSAKLEGASA